jgi:hypothetical protein
MSMRGDHPLSTRFVLPKGAEVELTGEAAPGFLGVYYDGQTVWVPAQYFSLGDRPGIDTRAGGWIDERDLSR